MRSKTGAKKDALGKVPLGPNIRYMLGNWKKWDGKSMWLVALHVPTQIALPALTALIPKLMLDAINGGWTPGRLIIMIALFSAMIAFLSWFDPNLQEQLKVSAQLARMRYRVMALRKIMRIDYQTLESEEGRAKLEKAKDFCFGGRWSAGEEFFSCTRGLLSAVFGLLTFAGLITRLTPALLGVVAIGCALEALASWLDNRFFFRSRDSLNPVYMHLDYIEGISHQPDPGKDIRLYNLRALLLSTMQKAVALHDKVQSKLSRQTVAGTLNLRTLASLLREAGAYYFLVRAVLKGEITPADFLFYFGIVMGFSGMVMALTGQWATLQRCCRTCQHFGEYLALPESASGGTLPAPESVETIEFRHVTFTYQGADEPVLRDLSFSITPGEKIAIVGLNGAGKTTLIKLLCGFYPTTSGEILINGVNIQAYERESYFRLFGAVFQDFIFLPLSVAQNVSMTEKGAEDKDQLDECLRNAGLLDKLLALPEGLDSPMVKDVWERAVNFSGGERQRLLLARALYKDAPVLILDEPTAALDPIAENRLYEKYAKFCADKISFFISHRIASTRFCGRIFYIENGVIAEEGDHEELLARGEAYFRLFETQSYYYRKELAGTEEDV
ncbi:MAG: ABC transporter ATP-binding protein/permease [Oscillospiraceae bacterium]|nr:ABC transporter ATP-binding protein/permease [Oscillospiraceae bacterium]